MRRILSGEPGLAAVVLVVLIAWALVAVLLLTGTLLAARRIDKDVRVIRPELTNIGHNTAFINLASTTERVSGQIEKAAAPLTGQLAQTLTSVHSIDARAKSILGHVGIINQTASTINTTVRSINGTVLSINGTVHAIDANANSINSDVLAINSSVHAINNNATAINNNVGSINSSVHSIHSNAVTILDTVNLIRNGVVAINNRAATIIGIAQGIGGDLHSVLGGVGTSNTAGGTILGHANSIDCAPLLNLIGRTASCGQ